MSKIKQRFWGLAMASLLAAMLLGSMAAAPVQAGDRLRPFIPPPSPEQYQQQPTHPGRPYPGRSYQDLPPEAHQKAMMFRSDIQGLSNYELEDLYGRIRADRDAAIDTRNILQARYLNLLLDQIVYTKMERGPR